MLFFYLQKKGNSLNQFCRVRMILAYLALLRIIFFIILKIFFKNRQEEVPVLNGCKKNIFQHTEAFDNFNNAYLNF